MHETTPDDDTVVIVVTRTGGLAGLHRAWRAEPRPDEASAFADLIARCPWEDPAQEGTGADRFVWSIDARCGPDQHEAEVPDGALSGPWRDLVDAVREWHAPDD